MIYIKLKKISVGLFSSLFVLTSLLFSSESDAYSNPQLINYTPDTNIKAQYIYGSNYWKTSNIREWLNSKETTVHYTNDPPVYRGEAGFLNQFTQEEHEAIAVTERRVNVASHFGTTARDGGSGDIPYYIGIPNTELLDHVILGIGKRWDKLYYQDVKEKVFILSAHELQEYIKKRGKSIRKQLTPSELKRLNRSNPYFPYATNTYTLANSTYSLMWQVNENGYISYFSIQSQNGITPAIHVKPSYQFNNGKFANELVIGEKILFGKYNDEPIEWEVINISDGHPLLWSDKILTVKNYDAPGTKILRDSESVNFETADVSINTSLKYTNKTNHSDTTAPQIRVANETDLKTRTNDAFDIFVEAWDEDGGSGIDYIILPDGRKDYRSMVNYKILENGRYEFTAVDKAGNHYSFLVPVGNISPPASVIITANPSNWTRENVKVNIETSLQQTTDYFVPFRKANGWYTIGYPSTYSTYANKKYRITGKIRLVSENGGIYPNSAMAVFYMFYNRLTKYEDIYYTVRTDFVKSYTVPALRAATDPEGWISFDWINTIQGEYFNELNFATTFSKHQNDTGVYDIEWKDLNIELLDKEELYIDTITLPNGDEIHQNTYSETLTEPGDYVYKVLDSRGKLTEKIVSVKIDKINPTATHALSTNEFTNQDVSITVTGADALSGVKRIKKPNGEWVNGHFTNYYVSQNGTYDFTIEDNAGNTFLYTVTVSHIDKEKPTIAFTPLARDWDISDIAVSIDIKDQGVSGIKQYRYAWSENQTKPASGWSGWYADTKGLTTTNKNGMLYLHIEAVDFAGNEIYSSSGLYKKLRENENPMINLSIFPQPGKWSNQFLEVSISENLDYSNDLYVEKRYEITNSPAFPTNVTQVLPLNRKVLLDQEGASYLHIQYTLSNGTRIKHSAGPYLIDRGKPDNYTTTIRTSSSAEITDWTNQRIYLAISNPVTTSVSGYTKQYRIENLDRDWQTYQENTEIIMEGAHRIFTRIVNEAGAAGSQQTVTSKLDKTPPTLNALNVVKETDGTYTVIVDANDSHSNIANIEVTMEDNTKKTTVSTNNLFRFSQLNKLPKHIVITDRASNRTPEITFASMPSITFAAPYNRVIPSYRGEIVTTISNGVNLNYQIGNKKLDCESNTCSFSVDRNTTIVATNTEGNKTASHTVAITNLDKSKLNLVMEGKRANNQIAFSWNYAITNGTLTCYKNGIKQENIHISGKDTSINATNAIYDCSLNGTYSAEVVQSNRVVIYPDTEQPVDAPEGGNGSIKNLYIEESRAGISYFVNTKSTNAQDSYVPLPPNAFGN